MQHVLDAMAAALLEGQCDRFPLRWPDARRAAMGRTAAGEDPGFSPLDAVLARALLLFGDGEFDAAEIAVLDVLRSSIDLCKRDSEAFISLLHALFVIQRLDLVAAMLKDRHGFPRDVQLAFEQGTVGVGCLRWEISSDRRHRFVFDAAALHDDNSRLEILAFHWVFPLLAHYAAQPEQEAGSVILSRTDIGLKPGLAYCDSRPDYFLIPDCIFVPTRGYEYERQLLRERAAPWAERADVAFWRGATTGVPVRSGAWRSLERIALCEIARRNEASGLIDAGISNIVQFPDPRVAQEIKESGLVRGPVPWQDWGRYKYLIDIDGNSSPWSNLLQRLLTGSTVLKVESARGLQQWFYDELLPWENYVPIAPDMWDLMDKIRWLNRNDGVAGRIGQNGLALAQRMTYERELQRGARVISAAFRYFRGERADAAPYGRVVRRSGSAGSA